MNIGTEALKRNTPVPTEYRIGTEIIPNCNSVKDLGITVDANMKFNLHIGNIVSKAFARSNLILKCFQSKNTATLIRAFTVYVRPLLEFNSSVWSPYLLKDINLIESVQRRFTKRLPGLYTIDYDERLSRLGLERLETRRIRTDLIITYKTLFGLIDIDRNKFFQFSDYSSTRGHHYKITVPLIHSDIRKNYFSYRVINNWNNLDVLLTDFSSLNGFKCSLSHFNARKACIGKT